MAKNLVLWAIIAAVLMTVFNNFQNVNHSTELKYSDFINSVDSGQVERVTISGQNIDGLLTNGESFTTVIPAYDDQLINDLIKNNVQVEGKKPEQQSIWTQLLVASFPILVIIAVFMLFMRQMQGGGGGSRGPMAFGNKQSQAAERRPDQNDL